MLHQNALLIARNHKLEEQLAVITKRKSRKRKRIQHSGTLEYSEGAAQIATEASIATERAKKACSSSNQERTQSALRHYRNCRGTGHNARIYKKDIEISSESDRSTSDAGSIFNSNKIEEL